MPPPRALAKIRRIPINKAGDRVSIVRGSMEGMLCILVVLRCSISGPPFPEKPGLCVPDAGSLAAKGRSLDPADVARQAANLGAVPCHVNSIFAVTCQAVRPGTPMHILS